MLVAFQSTVNEAAAQSFTNDPRASAEASHAQPSRRSREFLFHYGGVIHGLDPGQPVRVWLPLATSSHDQEVELLDVAIDAAWRKTMESKFGNETIYFEATANESGEIPLGVDYQVKRFALESTLRGTESLESAPDDLQRYLRESRLVPTGSTLRKTVMGSADASLASGSDLEKARRLYDGVDGRMKYDKPASIKGWGRGDAVWACDSQFGNCTDFHSLFISSARSLKIPCKFEIGFPISSGSKGEVGGYHCWAKFVADGKWVPVDISEADKHPEKKDFFFGNLPADRVMFSTGRDLKLDPPPVAAAVNYLAYPYVEVEGKPHTLFRKAFSFRDRSEVESMPQSMPNGN